MSEDIFSSSSVDFWNLKTIFNKDHKLLIQSESGQWFRVIVRDDGVLTTVKED